MKKSLIILLIAIIPIGMLAQDSTVTKKTATPELISKHGIPILPQVGDFAIGVDVIPYINFLGSTFSSGGNTLNPITSNTLYGKYYLDNNSAIRFELYTSHNDSKINNYVVDDAAVFINANSNAQVVDELKTNSHKYGIAAGYQKYRGYGRLRGTYGAQVSYSRENSIDAYTYGNQMNALNATPTTTANWSSFAVANPAQRLLKSNFGVTNGLGITALAGVEYFILPKICIGGEVGLSLVYSWSKQSNATYEEMQNLSGTPTRMEIDRATSPGNTDFSINTFQYGAPAGRIYVLFHF